MKAKRKLFKELEPTELNEFELEFLIPSTLDRFRYFRERFESLLAICDDEETAVLINGAVKKYLRSNLLRDSTEPLKPALNYLTHVKFQIQEYWIKEFDKFLNEFPDASTIPDPKTFLRFAQRAQNICSSVVWCKSRLLSYSIKGIPTLINRQTGEQIYDIPRDVEILTYPFEITLAEIESSATSLIESFNNWREGSRERRRDFVAFVTADTQLRSAVALNFFQILVIIFTIALTLGSDKILSFLKEIFHILQDVI